MASPDNVPTISLLLLSILLLLLQPCQAEKELQVSVDQQVVPGRLSNAMFATIHGSGKVDFARLHYDFKNSNEGIVTAASIFLPNKSDWNKLEKWQTDDTASTRARRDEYLASKGLGQIGKDGTYYVCCTEAALEAEACNLTWSYDWFSDEEEEKGYWNLSETGNMILKSPARQRVLHVNSSVSDLGIHGVMWFGETRLVALFFANCDSTSTTTDDGSVSSNDTTTAAPQGGQGGGTVHIYGTVTWTTYVSVSTLPLYIFLMICHGGLCLWYREHMNKNKDSRIQVEEWIFFTLFLATVAVGLKTIYYATEAFADDEWLNLSFAAEFSKSISRAVSRCLYLFLALGVGVTAPALENARTTILIGLFLGIFIVCDLAEDLTIYEIFFPFFMALVWTQLILSLTFMIWIPLAIRSTMKYLDFRNETMKLERYRWILRIYLLAMGLGILQVVIWVLDLNLNAGRDYSFMAQEEQEDITYLIIIACMACLWKPHPSQQMYSYQLLGEDGDMATPTNMSLELSEGKFGGTADHDLQLSATASL